MKIVFAQSRPADADVVAYAVKKDDLPALALPGVDAAGRAVLAAAATGQRFEGEPGSVAEAYVGEGQGVTRVLLLGVGGGDDASYERAGGALTAKLITSGAKDVTVDLAGSGANAVSAARLAAGAAQRGWRFDEYRTRLPEKSKATLATVTIAGAPAGSEEAWRERDAVTQGLALTRTLVTLPANILYPESFVERVIADADGLGLEIEVLDEPAMSRLGMGALLGVAQGSRRAPRLLAIRWNGAGAGEPAVALVGKGVTFDTGGISIKPAGGMEDMKGDMAGAACVTGLMHALASRKAKVNAVGVIGLVENMPDGNAQRPGDVVTSMSGQTVEVINTDAEGRLVLCDCITWAQKTHNVKTIVDLATLTGAMIISLGNEYGGLFSNDEGLADKLLAAGKASGDLLWRSPLGDAYNKLIDSQIADMKNVGPRGGGSITAAQFLQRFVEEGVKWAHLDIAGMVWADKDGATWAKGATGYGVRLLDRFVADNFEG